MERIGLTEKYTPGGSIFYLRTTYQKLLLDQIRKEVDPDYQEHFGNM